MTAAIAAVESVSECVERARVGAGAFEVDLKGDVVVEGVVVVGAVVAVVGVVVGGVVAVSVVVWCTLVDAGTGKVGVEFVPRGISREC